MKFNKISYANLNSRQKENFNFHKVSALLADYGFTSIRLTDDWEGADFIATHVGGNQFLKIQLKGRLTVDTKYKGKDIWIAFCSSNNWYLYPHDEFLMWALNSLNIGNTQGWLNISDWDKVSGVYSWPSLSQKAEEWLKANSYKL